jgi:glycosyltransferase involved in cell wall biosynthesis
MPLVFVSLLQSTGTKGGIEIYARELYAALGTLESEFTFVGYASTELAAKDTSWFPGEVINSGISGENRLTWALGELFSVNRAAARAGADMIHGPAMFGPARTRLPLVVSFHDLLYFSHPELMQSKLFTGPVKAMEKIAARNAERIITISENSRRAIEKYLKVSPADIDVIPLAGRATSAVANPSIPREDNLFLSIGQRSPYKNFETIVRAWALIPEAERPQLVITGSHGADPLVPLVAELALEPWVHLKEWVSIDELNHLFASATAIIDPTLAAGSSMPTLEAMNVGLPVLLADTAVFREVGADAANYFEAGNPASLAKAVVNLRDDPARLSELTRGGLQRSQGFSWNQVALQTLESFRLALSASKKSSSLQRNI